MFGSQLEVLPYSKRQIAAQHELRCSLMGVAAAPLAPRLNEGPSSAPCSWFPKVVPLCCTCCVTGAAPGFSGVRGGAAAWWQRTRSWLNYDAANRGP